MNSFWVTLLKKQNQTKWKDSSEAEQQWASSKEIL